MNVVELHYISATICGSNYLLIGRIADSPEGGCSFYTEVKSSLGNGSPDNYPSRIYYTINTYLDEKKDPTITITDVPGGFLDIRHQMLCLVKYTAVGESSPSWYVAINPNNGIQSFEVCNPEYSAGHNGYVNYKFINWFTDYLAVSSTELEDETNTLYTQLTNGDKTGLKAIRYPYLPRYGNTVMCFAAVGNIALPCTYIAIKLIGRGKSSSRSYQKVTLESSPFLVSGYYTYTIYVTKNNGSDNRNIYVTKDTIGESFLSEDSITGIYYLRNEEYTEAGGYVGDEYLLIGIKTQYNYSINFLSTKADANIRLVTLEQALSLANSTVGSITYTKTKEGDVETRLFVTRNSLAYNSITYPRVFKNSGTTIERNTLLSESNANLRSIARGIPYFDTDLKKPLFLTSTQTNETNGWYWVDANGNNPDIPTKGTTSQRPATTDITEGFKYYNTETHKEQIYNGTTWLDVEDTADTDSKVNGLIPDIVTGHALSTTLAAAINKYYRFDTAVDELTVTLPELVSSAKVQNVVVYLTAGSNADSTTITFAAATPTEGTAAPVYYQKSYDIEAGKTYEINALYNGAAWIIAAVEIVTAAPQSSNASNNSLLMGGFTPLDNNSGNAETPDVEPENTEDI